MVGFSLIHLTFTLSLSPVIELISNLEVRRRWEKRFPIIEIVEEFPKYKIVYWYVSAAKQFIIAFVTLLGY